jgi:hypothetical protein
MQPLEWSDEPRNQPVAEAEISLALARPIPLSSNVSFSGERRWNFQSQAMNEKVINMRIR